MRFGGPVFLDPFSPAACVRQLKEAGYSATYWPNVPDDAVEETVRALADADIVIAEVGAWSNPMDRDAEKRREAIEKCKQRLALAERVGARCCVNIVGSKGAFWHGPCPDDLTEDAFDEIVEVTREIVDAVGPQRTAYCLETMPWLFPDSADAYLQLIQAIDRKGFAVHLDPVNLVHSPRRYFENAALIRECFATLGPHIRSCHAKDIVMSTKLTVHLDEVPLGQGALDYATYLAELAKLEADTPLMMEHMSPDEYPAAAEHVRKTAQRIGVTIR